MRSVIFVGLGLFAAPILAANPNESDSFCERFFGGPESSVWRVDDNLASQLNVRSNGSISLDDTEMLNAVDQVFQNWPRQSRVRIRARVKSTVENCFGNDGDTRPCIEGALDSEDNECLDATNATAAHAGCDLDGCSVVFCLDNLEPGVGNFGNLDWGGQKSFATVLEHELGHVYGLTHVETCSGSNSDGCEGELMCSAIGTLQGPHLSFGDSRGVRQKMNGSQTFQNRQVHTQSHTQGSSAITTSDLSRLASHMPRIDCAEQVNGTATCVAIVPFNSSGTHSTKVVKLNSWGVAGWGSNVSAATVNSRHMFAPDIAITPDGTVAYVSAVSEVNNNAWVWRVDLGSGATTMASLGYEAALPTRIAWNEDIGRPVVVGAIRDESGPTWRMDRVNFSGGSLTNTKLTLPTGFETPNEGGSRQITGDFDFDCRVATGAADDCVLVAVLHDDTSSTRDVGKSFSHHFRVTTTTVTFQDDPNWVVSAQQEAQAIIGVALSPTRLVVSEGRRAADGSTSNTRRIEFAGLSEADSNFSFSTLFRSDAITCTGGTVDGVSFGAATPHGGNSISWCGTCGTAGRLEGLTFGLREGGDALCW